jgi:hypothetical protein
MSVDPMRNGWLCLMVSFLLSACVTQPVQIQDEPSTENRIVKVEASPTLPLLGYYLQLHGMSPHELVRERGMLAAQSQTPESQIRMAMLLGQTRGPTDLARALKLLDGALKSADPAAVGLRPLARVLTNHYQERQRLEMQNEKLAQQSKDAQRRSSELQEKLDAMADIERSIPVRPTTGNPPSGVSR